MDPNNGRIFTPGTAVFSTSTVEVSISGRGLKDTDILSKSDPMCVVYQRHLAGTNTWTEVLRTETIWDNLDPDFVAKLIIDYRFEEEQPLRFELYDIDNPHSNSLVDHDFLGYAECTLGQIIARGYMGLQLPLSEKTHEAYSAKKILDTSKLGFIILCSEEMQDIKEELVLKFSGINLGQATCCLFSHKVFFIISKSNESGKYTVVYRSDEQYGTDPFWKEFSIQMRSLCNGDRDRDLKLDFFQVGVNGYHTALGTTHTNVNQLETAFRSGERIHIVGKNNGSGKGGYFVINDYKINRVFTFLDYIRNGTQIHCCVAIDFTASNGDPNDPNSLHHFSGLSNRSNPYEQAIESVISIIQDYDSTKMFATYGFGARIPPNGIVSHKFFVTMQQSPYCEEMAGVLANYRKCINQVQLAGPTCFAPIIREVGRLASQNQNGQHYYILLMITDGIINDMDQTIESIVQAATLPLSIIIVGVGHANFDAMEVLDGDTVRLSSNGKAAARDIVQFVPYRDAYTWVATATASAARSDNTYSPASVSYHGAERTFQLAKTKLAQELLAEIPTQLVGYMKSRGIQPPRV